MQDQDLIDAVFSEAPADEVPAEIVEPTPEKVEAPTPEPVAEVPVEPKTEHTVPLPKYLDLRDENKELKRWKAEQEAKQPQAVPDPIDDPDGHTNYLRSEMGRALETQRLEFSDQLARGQHGDETVDKAVEWALEQAKADPSFGPRYMRERNPIDWIVRQHKREGLVAQLPSDISSLDEWFEREVAKRGLAQAATPVVAQPQPAVKAPAPPKSIASDISSPGATQDSTADFMDIFTRK